MRKIGLFGGSFNPIHEGHVAIAQAVRKSFHLQEIWFLPTVATPLKNDQLVSYKQRCDMVKLAIKPYRYMKLSKVESLLSKPSYTVNTVQFLKRKYTDVHFYWIIGYDQYAQLDKWYRIDDLKKLVQFIVVNRGKADLDTEFLELPYFEHPASSTAIREGDFHYLYPSVRHYIEKHVLYYKDFLPVFYTHSRWAHALSVADWSQKIAIHYHQDGNAALLAGYLHDVAKKLKREEMLEIMQYYFPKEMDLDIKVWHQFVGYYIAKYDYGIYNRDILKAILHHTTATNTAMMSKILYCADKIDDTRDYDVSYFRDLVFTDINCAFKEIYDSAETYRLKEK